MFPSILVQGHILIIILNVLFTNNPDICRLLQGYVFYLFNNIIIWRATRQNVVIILTIKTEIHRILETGKEIITLQNLFRNLKLDLGGLLTIFCNNKQAIRLIVGKNKHITTILYHINIQNL
jgi:hypothetical protein